MSWTIAEERPIYWEEPPEQIAVTNKETGEWDAYMLTSKAAERIRELRYENTRLRSCLSDTDEHASMFMWEVKQLEEERDKLRELVMRAEKLMQGVLDNAGDTVVVSDLPCCDTLFDSLSIYREDMRELGIEVEE